MIFKPSAVLEALHETSIVQHQSNAPTFDPSIQYTHSLPRREQVASQDLEGYQTTSLPFPSSDGGGPPQNDGMGQPLLVPLIWSQLITQVRREMAHSTAMKESRIVRFDEVHIDLLAMEVCRSGRPVSLTAMEFKVLRFFVSNPNRVIPRDDMLNQVWGYENYPCTRTVDNHVLKLRQKLELDPAHPVHFRTVHGMGYKFMP